MAIDRRLTTGLLGLVLVVAACGSSGGGATPTPAASTAPEPAPSEAAPSEAPPSEAPPSEAPPSDSGGGGGGDTGGLEALLPSEVGGVTFEKAGFDGSQLGVYGAAAGLDQDGLGAFLAERGKSIADVRFAVATSTDSTEVAMVYAIQIRGVPATEFMGASGIDPEGLTNATVGGKAVLEAGAGGYWAIAYPKDDVLYYVYLVGSDLGPEILSGLP